MSKLTDDDISESTFFFESDQLAFKGNEDYQLVLSSLAKFEGIRNKALSDLDKLLSLRNEAQADPLAFVNKLQNDPKSLDVPSRPKIPEVPNIDWGKYSYTAAASTTTGVHCTRGKKVHVPLALIHKKVKSEESADDVTIIRGRVKSDLKPDTFNQLWTTEEQRKLEELLILFPSERIEARRYRKIANELGTKTLQQVASRVQKYFIRLAQCGLPIPGKVPNLAAHKKKAKHKHSQKNKCILPSTFLQAYVPPVYMPDDDDLDSVSAAPDSINSDSDSSDSDLELPDELKDSDEYCEFVRLKKLRQQKLCDLDGGSGNVAGYGGIEHFGYTCDGCGQNPILGTRYHCMDCPQDSSVDFCSSCNRRSITLAQHRPGHKMAAIEEAESEAEGSAAPSTQPAQTTAVSADEADRDYLPSKFNIPGHYNYLDPNYLPNSDRA